VSASEAAPRSQKALTLHRQRRQVAWASFIGTSIEWYDYYLYGTAAALIFPAVFFPEDSPAIGVIKAFATYAVGFMARPLGGFLFGHYGDRIGRKAALIATLLLMGVSTLLIGVLPSHAQVGVWAPLLLGLLRLIQGFAVGGEWGGAVVIAVEHAPAGRRGLFGSFPQLGVPAGLLLSSVVFAAVNGAVGAHAFAAWGWRLPFLFSGVLVIIGLVLRLSLTESPLFQQVKDSGTRSRRPSLEVVRRDWRTLLTTTGMKLFQNAVFYIYSVFMLSYISGTLGLSKQIGLNAIIISSIVGFASIPGWSYLSDKIGRKKVYLAGCVLGTVFFPINFVMADTGNVVVLTIGMIIGLNVLHDMIYGPQAVYFSELFSTRVRLSGASIGYQIGAMISGGFAPLIAAALLTAQHGATWGISIYIVGLGVISIVATLFARETLRDSLQTPADAAAEVASTV
jgi:metabolite-proton symporter